MHVLIIGGGTGGMCLAHGLRQAGVSVDVFERYATRTDGLHGYRIGIDPTGGRALQRCLPPEVYDAFVSTCARTPRSFNVFTERMRTTASIPLPDTSDRDVSEQSVSRAILRQVLFTGMEDSIHFGKVFRHYETLPDGRVTAHFDDGTSATGDVLVAADGTRSAVRQQYLPHAAIGDTGITAIATKTQLTDDTRRLLAPAMERGISLIFAARAMMGLVHVMQFPESDAAVGSGVRDLMQDYVNVSVWSTHAKFPSDVMELRGGDLLAALLSSTEGWHPNLHTLIERSDPAAAFPIRIVTSKPVEPRPPSQVTLLGDAIHTMTPGQGVGANTALRDAAILSRELAAAANGSKSLLDAIHAYEQEMVPYGFARVADSLNNNGTTAADPLYKGGMAGRLALFGARGYFRLTSGVPALRRKFIAELSTYRGRALRL